MRGFFRFDTEVERRALLARARQGALKALQAFDVEWKGIQFIQLSDTITYKIECDTAPHYLLRIHSDRLSREEIRSELLWLQSLNASQELNVPEGIVNREGLDILEIETEAGYKSPYVTMMRWVEGEHVQGELTDRSAYNMGVLMAKLHAAARTFTPPSEFARPNWGLDSFYREIAKLEQYYERFLSDEGWMLYQAAIRKVMSELAAMQPNEHNYGLIHADLHLGNVVFQEEEPYPIDFGRCGYGYYLYDLAGAVLELWPKHRWFFIQGYKSIRRLESDYAQQLPCFLIMFMIENYCHHASNPREAASLIEEQKYAQAYIKAYLNNKPFLFEVIEPVEV
ncbi:hypothetical protein PA598K_05297 [Paenibacillus sp. 598K]|uniref:phosphotransferase enzyme family protein n=1 Tax=Paenibacillus sp. 598K TaxID=1117987 RepID=UPI000FF9DE01|nr:phosphotransferase [Paenibacillus sp. 598K]GBF76805.1 hypothetical protein PA598K_05297 [Paenibacillus sp. 598K]